jgi:hypothetical protein
VTKRLSVDAALPLRFDDAVNRDDGHTGAIQFAAEQRLEQDLVGLSLDE